MENHNNSSTNGERITEVQLNSRVVHSLLSPKSSESSNPLVWLFGLESSPSSQGSVAILTAVRSLPNNGDLSHEIRTIFTLIPPPIRLVGVFINNNNNSSSSEEPSSTTLNETKTKLIALFESIKNYNNNNNKNNSKREEDGQLVFQIPNLFIVGIPSSSKEHPLSFYSVQPSSKVCLVYRLIGILVLMIIINTSISIHRISGSIQKYSIQSMKK